MSGGNMLSIGNKFRKDEQANEAVNEKEYVAK